MRSALYRVPATVALVACLLSASAAAKPVGAHGQLLRLVRGPRGTLNAGQSNNWFGYNEGALEAGAGLFHSITGNWTVPRARQHLKGQAEDSSDWIGIGGGCVNSGCGASDATLIQTGTEQDVSAAGAPSYSAWWEVIPGPSVSIAMKIRPGDRMHASIVEILPASEVWKITLSDLTTGKSHSMRVPYSSTQDSAEWIEETPLLLGANAGLASLPRLSSPSFDRATVNGGPAHLRAAQAIDLINSSGNVIGAPSAPDGDRDGFNACTWTRICAAPRRS
ncbi:MAG TPA: G1 family glutamic endopeptidase [Solirubrobacteraceae bacterium]